MNDNGDTIFPITVKALVYRPLKNEVIDGVVKKVEQFGIEVEVGACVAFIPHTKIPSDLKYNEQINAFVSEEDPNSIIKKDELLRFKVENVSIKGQEGSSMLVSEAISQIRMSLAP